MIDFPGEKLIDTIIGVNYLRLDFLKRYQIKIN